MLRRLLNRGQARCRETQQYQEICLLDQKIWATMVLKKFL